MIIKIDKNGYIKKDSLNELLFEYLGSEILKLDNLKISKLAESFRENEQRLSKQYESFA